MFIVRDVGSGGMLFDVFVFMRLSVSEMQFLEPLPTANGIPVLPPQLQSKLYDKYKHSFAMFCYIMAAFQSQKNNHQVVIRRLILSAWFVSCGWDDSACRHCWAHREDKWYAPH